MRDMELICFACMYFSANNRFPALNVKQLTLSVIRSPITLSAPSQLNPTHIAHSHNTMTNPNWCLTSCAVGEFKGWFSNPFNWKAHHPPWALRSSTPQMTSWGRRGGRGRGRGLGEGGEGEREEGDSASTDANTGGSGDGGCS